MTEEIRNDVLNASERDKKKYEAFHNERILSKTLKISATIHRMNLKTMISIKNKSTRTTKKVIREMNMTEKSIEIARDRGLATEDLLKYDVLPSPMLFDDHGLMTKPEKSQLIRELEDKLVSDDYSYHHKPESAFIIDVIATFRRVPLIGRTHFSDLLLQLTHITDVYHRYGRCDYIFDIYNDNPSVKGSERLRRCSVNPVVLSLVEQTTPLPKDMSTFWPSNKNKLLLEKLIYSYICEQSPQGHEHPTIVSQLCINSNDWQCKKIHHSTENYMQHLGSTVEEADLRIPRHVLDCCRAGYKTCVVISNDTDVIVALLFYVPVFLQEGLMELWIRAGRGNTSRFLPLHTLYASLDRDLCTVLPAIHSLTGCDITSKIGTKKAALKANPETHLQGFGTSPPSVTVIQHSETYLLHVVDNRSKSRSFDQLRTQLFHFSKSASHQNLPPTSQGLKPHIYRAFYNAYITMHILDRQLNVRTENLNPVDYGFRLEDGQLLPSTSWKTLEARWFVAVFYKVMLESCKGILIYEEILISVNLIFAKKMVKKRMFCNILLSYASTVSIEFSFAITEETVKHFEEFPIKSLQNFVGLTGEEVTNKSVLVLNFEYGPDFSGPGKDTFKEERAVGAAGIAHKSNFLHPVFYFYDKLPSGSWEYQ
ncbi:FAD-dependent oxidoreductase domain-containing protein 2 [Nymphon striatum]|nr:FAD-dependent oxidoreductase domain-containing protein 2 [Nymphon striatum]